MNDAVNGNTDGKQETSKEYFLDFLSNLEEWVERQNSLLSHQVLNAADINKAPNAPDLNENDIDITKPWSLSRAQTYFTMLDNQLNDLSQKDKSQMSDDEKNSILQLFMRLKSLHKRVNEWSDIQKWVRQWTMDLLADFSFLGFSSLEQFDSYLFNNDNSTSWNSLMLGKFIWALDKYLTTIEERKKYYTRLFNIPGVRWCNWSDQMLNEFTVIVKRMKGVEKVELKKTFNRLPKIVNRKDRFNSTRRPWSVLYIDIDETRGSWHLRSHLWGIILSRYNLYN